MRRAGGQFAKRSSESFTVTGGDPTARTERAGQAVRDVMQGLSEGRDKGRICRPGIEATCGDEDERSELESELVSDGLPLVAYLVNDVTRTVPRYVHRDDLVSAGMLGLVLAARSFDPSRGVPFRKYASLRIRGAVLDELRSFDWATRSVRAHFREFQRVADEIMSKCGREPTRDELAAALNVDEGTLTRLLGEVHRATVLNYDSIVESEDFQPVLSSGDECPEHAILDRERCAYLRAAVAALPERHRYVIMSHFWEDRPLHSLAGELGVSESRVSQMHTEALRLLRDAMTAQLDPEPRPVQAPECCAARRRAAYRASAGALSDFRSRVSAKQSS